MKHLPANPFAPLGLGLLTIGLIAAPAQAQSKDELIKNALSAAPLAIAANATVVDHEGNLLKEGSNGYTCLPDDPRPGNSPMCLDAGWLGWADSWMNQKPVKLPDGIAFAYMLQGDAPVSNTDPYATERTDDNEWLDDIGPHLMILVPDLKMLEGFTSDPDYGGPYVMWRGTQYAHLMVPVAP